MAAAASFHRNRGAALITVLFLVMAITIIALGLFARTDMSLAASRNFVLRTKLDALAYSALEYGRFLAGDPNLIFSLPSPVPIEGIEQGFACKVTIEDPNDRLYKVKGSAWFTKEGEVAAESILVGRLYSDPNCEPGTSYYRQIERVR
ncbi:MAG TPA: hypothetical protein PLX18_06265 [Anaerohalosphaeraceae bacterium]|jgi:hypothetical protein|nr:hypothetical protein [Anaerohalosphaeraceae bacterium]HQG04914.1 hypothetical protein [Anaerohalosphaeraceae bacterium]HQI07449.1 hypothetical protein [Anaerohalosphaeraceae bacterium]HQJ67651.1 hypothetical protein [Anaerohalosphaeraceae bacterium]